VFTRGHRDVTAICTGDGEQLFVTDDALQGPDELDALQRGGDYGSAGIAPVLEVPGADGGLGGCAVSGPYVFLGALDGQQVLVVQLDGTGVPVEEPEPFLADEYGRLRSLAIDVQGALWVTTSNRDGVGTPTEDDDRVLRVQPPSSGGGSPL
jgi:glucose/arabinose dehydrogenase